MGYTTDFKGKFTLIKPLTADQAAYLRRFSETRRMGRIECPEANNDPLRVAVGLPIGPECGYYVNGSSYYGSKDPIKPIDYNNPPAGQPGLWCQWVPTEDLAGIEWDEGEKFYHYVEWANYILEHFLMPWGNGYAASDIEYEGEVRHDYGKLVLTADGRVEAVPHQCCNK